MSTIKPRMIFKENFASLNPRTPNFDEIEEKYLSVIAKDKSISSLSESKKADVRDFIVNCIFVAQSSHSKISVSATEGDEGLVLLMHSPLFYLNSLALALMSDICLSASEFSILPQDLESDQIIICISYDLI